MKMELEKELKDENGDISNKNFNLDEGKTNKKKVRFEEP